MSAVAHVGFTGTQSGLTPHQLCELQHLLLNLRVCGARYFHHGDCVGADAEAHDVAKGLGYLVVLHPPDDDSRRAFKAGDELRAPAPYLTRNREIVAQCDVLLAAPATRAERRRSGTWSTVRYAERVGRRTVKLWPAP